MEVSSNIKEDKFKIKKVTSSSSLINPILLNVGNRAWSQEELNSCECSWYKDKTESSELTRVVNFVNSNKDTFEGTTKLGGSMCKTMLVLQRKKNNKIQIIEVDECRLERVIHKENSQTNYDNDEIDNTYEENRSKLLKAFGSKKSKRVSEVGSKMRINTDMMTSQIKHKAAEMNVDVRELELADSTVDTCLPPCHRDASDPADVYQLHDFLSTQELDSMEDEAFTILHLMPFTEEASGYSQFFIDTLDHLQNKVSIERIKILLVVDALIKFITLPFKTIKKKDLWEKICPFSTTIKKKIIEEYTVDTLGGRTRNVTMEDKAVIHIMVLVIIACESCNTDQLSKYLQRFNVKKIGQIARALCLSTKDKVTWFVKLPLPRQQSGFMRRRK